MVLQYLDRNPDWILVRHEDLSRDPIPGFRQLYQKLGLEFTRDVGKKIGQRSVGHNPSEQLPGKEFIRNSQANVDAWKRKLTCEERDRVHEGTRIVCKKLYGAQDW